MSPRASLRVAVFGPTGVTGRQVLKQCLDDSRVTSVTAVTRRPIDLGHPKLVVETRADFSDVNGLTSAMRGPDTCLYCLGISQQQVSDPARYREITFDYAMAAARAFALVSPKGAFHFVSGGGADPSGRSRMMWARVKGETEVALGRTGLATLIIWRLGYIYPIEPRIEPLLSDTLLRSIAPMIRRVLPWLVTDGREIGRAMLQAAFENTRGGTFENRDIQKFAQRYRAQEPGPSC